MNEKYRQMLAAIVIALAVSIALAITIAGWILVLR